MIIVTLDKNGHIPLPPEILEKLGINLATELKITIQDGKLIIEPLRVKTKMYYAGQVLVIESKSQGNLETAINNFRAQRIEELRSC